MIKYSIYTDGSCLGNPGVGGWAFLLKSSKNSLSKQGNEVNTTNNRMEMQAIIEALFALGQFPDPARAAFFSDSRLIINTLTLGWKRKTNLDLWAALDKALANLIANGWKIDWNWVKGHAGQTENEIVNALAQKAAAERQGSGTIGPKPQTKELKNKPLQTQILLSEMDTELRNLIEENVFTCGACAANSLGVLSRKSATGPIRVDCAECGKYIKFAKQSK